MFTKFNFFFLFQIVWDSDKNRWVNVNSDEDDSGGAVPPPPKASDLAAESIPKPLSTAMASNLNPSFIPNSNPVGASEHSDNVDASSNPSLPPSGPNKYKMARGKSMYIGKILCVYRSIMTFLYTMFIVFCKIKFIGGRGKKNIYSFNKSIYEHSQISGFKKFYVFLHEQFESSCRFVILHFKIQTSRS